MACVATATIPNLNLGLFTIVVLGESVVAVASGIAQEDVTGDAAFTGVLGFGIAAAVFVIVVMRVPSES